MAIMLFCGNGDKNPLIARAIKSKLPDNEEFWSLCPLPACLTNDGILNLSLSDSWQPIVNHVTLFPMKGK